MLGYSYLHLDRSPGENGHGMANYRQRTMVHLLKTESPAIFLFCQWQDSKNFVQILFVVDLGQRFSRL